MTYFVMIEDAELETLVGAVDFSTRHYQGQLGEILRERIVKLGQGEATVLGWKAEKADELVRAIYRLGVFGDKLRDLPSGRDCNLV